MFFGLGAVVDGSIANVLPNEILYQRDLGKVDPLKAGQGGVSSRTRASYFVAEKHDGRRQEDSQAGYHEHVSQLGLQAHITTHDDTNGWG